MKDNNQTLNEEELDEIIEETLESNDTLTIYNESALYEEIEKKDNNHVWAFCSGHKSQDFRGNPKYLFLYIQNYRSDIFAYWLCDDIDVIEMIRNMGYPAFQIGTSEAIRAIVKTGVFVSEQVKSEIPSGLYHAKYLNLWHGVGGVKSVERAIKDGQLIGEMVKKYTRHNEYYRTYQLYLAPSKFIEGIAREQLGLSDKQIIRAGYPRDIYQINFEKICTFNHDLIENNNLPEDTRIVAYIPTWRNSSGEAFFAEAFPDLDKLVKLCEQKHLLFIFKMHPYYENDINFLAAKEKYNDCPWFVFWDNADDIYEILDKIDLCIMDYSSMFTDMIVAGVKYFLRYTFDFNGEDLDFPMDYDKVTPGPKCKTYDELLTAINNYENVDLSESLNYISNLYWEYSTPDSLDRIVEQTIAFEPVKPKLKTLYSFDIFDTVFSRKVLEPVGVFYKVKEKMEEDGSFPEALTSKYPSIHKNTELIIRDYYKKSTDIRNSESLEISLDEILERIQWVYGLTKEQTDKLRKWEIEVEIENVIPLRKQIDLIKQYLEQGDEVVLVSDMYLPKEVIVKMLEKADPILTQIPLFLSNEYGVLKAHKSLYYEVYKSFEPFYDFKKWVHYGDNVDVDQNAARACGISTRKVSAPAFNEIQQELVKYLDSYDGYLVAALQSRICSECYSDTDRFIASYITLIMVPYIDWVLRDAIRREYQTLYFVSRDGHPLIRIADAIIKERGLNIKTKLIYASRRTWRVPSFINEVDPCFWQAYANFGDIVSSEKLLKAMSLDEETFKEFFPGINLEAVDYTDKNAVPSLVEQFKSSEKYKQYLLDLAAKERPIVSGYLKQEIDNNEKFAIVEYWGRGYTQDTMVRLWRDVTGEECDVPFYYTRTVLPSANGAIRYNFTTNSAAQFFIEGFFANMPYKSIEKYCEENGRIVPVIEPIPYNREIYGAMQRILPLFACEYAKLPISDWEKTDHLLYDFVLNYYTEHRDNEYFAEHIGSMIDSVAAYGKKREFAPPLTNEVLERLANCEMQRGDSKFSTCITMSITRTEEDVKDKYFKMYQILPGDDIVKGRLLSAKEQKANQQAKEQYSDFKKRIQAFQSYYRECLEETEVQNTVLFVFNGKIAEEYPLQLLGRIEKDTFYKCKTLLLGKYDKKDDKLVAKKIASAKIILAANPIHLFSGLGFREETEYILLSGSPFQLYNSGIMQYDSLKWKEKLVHLMSDNRFNKVMIPSVQEEETFLSRFGGYGETRGGLYGSCVSDIYFDERFLADSVSRVNNIFPETMDKKIILYMPSARTISKSPEWLSVLDMEKLRELIGEDYVVLVNFNKTQLKAEYKNVIEIPGFSKDVSDVPIRNLIAAADVVIGDYRDSFFETVLLHKPAFSTAWDYEKMIQNPKMSQNSSRFEQILFCPVIETSEELALQLDNLDNYDFKKLDEFRERFFGACDGKSEDRLISYITSLYKLTPEQKEENEKWHKKVQELEEIGNRFKNLYIDKCNKIQVSNSVLVLSESVKINNTGIELVLNSLKGEADVQVCFLDKKIYGNQEEIEKIAERIAGAKVIISNSPIKILCKTEIRKESNWLLLKDNPYPLAKRSHKKKYRGNWRSEYEMLTEHCNCTCIQIPGPQQVEAFTNLYLNHPLKKEKIIWGCCNTDRYFDESYIISSNDKLRKIIGDNFNKKKLLYMPTVGNIKDRDKLPIDLIELRNSIPDDYIIILNLKKNQKETLKEKLVIPTGCYEVDSEISLMELVIACDVIVGDYRNTFFEAALLRKPCYSTAYDSAKVMMASSGGIVKKDIEEMQFTNIIKSGIELAGELEIVEEFDYSKMDLFRVNMLPFCDGHSLDRVLTKVFSLLK